MESEWNPSAPVYGLLALGLVLVVLRRLWPSAPWNEKRLSLAFWHMNAGLALMVTLSLLPVGLLQAHASIETGLWWARSAEFLQQPLLRALRWMRVIGDVTFTMGVGFLVWFVAGLLRSRHVSSTVLVTPGPASLPRIEPEVADEELVPVG